MIAREAVLNDSEVVQLLREHFVCLAVDNADNLNLTPADKEWLKDRGGRACTQGMSVFTAGGTLLGSGGGYEPAPVKRMLEESLKKFQPETSIVVEDTGKDLIPRPPAGGLVLTVTWKVLAGAPAESSATSGNGTYDETFLHSLGVDRLWVRKDEAASLAQGEFPESLRRRMASHLKRVLPGGLKDDHLTLSDGRLARFVKQYAQVGPTVVAALGAFRDEVRSGAYPGPEHTYEMPAEEVAAFLDSIAAPQPAANYGD